MTIRNARRSAPLWVDAGLDGAAGGFVVLSGGGATRIPPRGKLVVQVSFVPSARGPAAATLDVRTSDPDRADALVRLSGRGR